MKLFGVALGVGLAASSSGETLDYGALHSLYTGCVASAGVCKDGDVVVAGALDEAACAESGYTFVKTLPDDAALEAAIAAAEPSLGESGLFLATLKAGVSAAEAEAGAPEGVVAGDFIFCGENKLVFLSGTAAAVRVENDFYEQVAAFPAVYKRSPYLDSYEAANTPPAGTRRMRRAQLAPGARGRAREVIEGIMAKHAGRRMLMGEAAGSGDLVVGVEFPHHEARLGRRALQEADEVLSTKTEIIASTTGSAEELEWLTAETDLGWVEPVVYMSNFNYDAVTVTQAGTDVKGGQQLDAAARAPLSTSVSLDGSGEIVGIGDSGLDTAHCHFVDPAVPDASAANRAPGQRYDYPTHRKVVQYVAFVDGNEGEQGGHGTHVAGSVAGIAAGAGGDNTNQGMAPAAKIAFFDLGQAGSGSIFPPQDLGETMFKPAYEIGARIHTNSWGGNLNAYTPDSRGVDTFTWANQDMLVLYANGNSGYNPQGNVGTPATAKNALSVGASMNAERSWQAAGRNCYPANAPGTPNCVRNMAPFSSSGPASDGRIKPDVSAPGMFINSANSGTTCGSTLKAGTSMATPVTAGNAALVRQFLREGLYPTGVRTEANKMQPMGALIKAIFVNGADLMDGSYENPGTATLDATKPNPNQGFGRTNLGQTLLATGNSPAKSVFLDGDMRSMPTLSAAGGTQEYTFRVAAGQAPLRATLVWFDPPATLQGTQKLINDLDITVTGPDGTTYYPNGLNTKDGVNTVEQVEIPAASLAAGEYKVVVTAAAINQGPQPFAFAFSAPMQEAREGDPPPIDIVDEDGNNVPPVTPGNPNFGGTPNTPGGSPNTPGGTPSADSAGLSTGIIVAIAGAAGVVLVVAGVAVSRRGKSASAGGPSNFVSPQYGQPPQNAVVPGGGNLPPGWAPSQDPNSGQTYYYNRSTGQTSWEVPKY